MSGYINRDDFVAYERKQHCDNCFMSDDHGLDPCPVCWLYSLLKEAEDYPAADVAPVVHGRWVWNDDNGYYYCKHCGAISPREDQDGEYIDCPNYCHNCGAKMSET